MKSPCSWEYIHTRSMHGGGAFVWLYPCLISSSMQEGEMLGSGEAGQWTWGLVPDGTSAVVQGSAASVAGPAAELWSPCMCLTPLTEQQEAPQELQNHGQQRSGRW